MAQSGTPTEMDALTEAKFQRAALVLLESGNLDDALARLKISRSSLWRWLRDPRFQSVFHEARRQVSGHALARLQAASVKAAGLLERAIDDEAAPLYVRVSAAREVLQVVLKLREQDDLEARLSALEEAMRDRGTIEGQAQ